MATSYGSNHRCVKMRVHINGPVKVICESQGKGLVHQALRAFKLLHKSGYFVNQPRHARLLKSPLPYLGRPSSIGRHYLSIRLQGSQTSLAYVGPFTSIFTYLNAATKCAGANGRTMVAFPSMQRSSGVLGVVISRRRAWDNEYRVDVCPSFYVAMVHSLLQSTHRACSTRIIKKQYTIRDAVLGFPKAYEIIVIVCFSNRSDRHKTNRDTPTRHEDNFLICGHRYDMKVLMYMWYFHFFAACVGISISNSIEWALVQ